MKYIPPLNALPGDEENENRAHWNADPDGVSLQHRQGAWPDALGFEAVQREIVNFIIAAGLTPNEEDYTQLQQAMEALLPTETSKHDIGVPFPIFDNIAGAWTPDNSGDEKYIKLTAGLTGSGQFNEGLLTSESVSGSFPNNTATAEIVGGDMDGQTVALINTEKSFLRPNTSSGVYEQDAFKSHSHTQNTYLGSGSIRSCGATGGSSSTTMGISTSSAGSTETRPKNRTVTYYMRII